MLYSLEQIVGTPVLLLWQNIKSKIRIDRRIQKRFSLQNGKALIQNCNNFVINMYLKRYRSVTRMHHFCKNLAWIRQHIGNDFAKKKSPRYKQQTYCYRYCTASSTIRVTMRFCCKSVTDLLPDWCEILTKLIHFRNRSAAFLLDICIKVVAILY